MDREGPAAAEARAFAAALERGEVKVTAAWVPGDDDPAGNWTRWTLSRYCFDREGQVLPAMVDALDRWPMQLFEQIVGVGAERSDFACAWQDFRHKSMRADVESQARVNAEHGR